MTVWIADNSVFQIVDKVKAAYHDKRLADARIAVSIIEAKAFIKDRFNWGKTSKFSTAAKIWHADDNRYDFLITIPSESWNILDQVHQREAFIDLHLNCMQVEFEVETIEKNGKKIPVKDDYGRKVYTDVLKVDEEGIPKWKVVPLDINVIMDNVTRYGCWCQSFIDLKSAIKTAEGKAVRNEVTIEEVESKEL